MSTSPAPPDGDSLGDTLRRQEMAPAEPGRTVRLDERATSLPSSVAADPLETAGTPFGRYRLLESLGAGGMGVVWKAYDTHLKRAVALKQVRVGGDAHAIERFLREAQLAARLRHPSIVAVHDAGCQDGQHYLTCDLVDGRPLDRVLAQPVPLPVALGWLRSIAEALHAAHGQGVVHRDVKPANILIDRENRAFLADFGLAKELVSGSGLKLTASGALVGTPQYMSPEQAAGRTDQVGPATDQYSLGAVMYELLCGRPAFESENLRDLLIAIPEQEPPPPSARKAGVSADAEAVCLRAMAKAPAARYASLRDFADDLARLAEGRPVLAGCARSRRPGRRAIVAAAAALVALAVGWVALRPTDPGHATPAARPEGKAIAEVFRRWEPLLPAVEELERIHAGPARNDRAARSAERMAACQALLPATPDRPDAQSAALALTGWCDWLGGRDAAYREAVARAASLAPDLPLAPLVEAMAAFEDWAARRPVAFVTAGLRGVVLDPPPPESEARLAERRALLDRLVAALRPGPADWEASADLAAAAQGLKALVEGDPAAAEPALSRALEAPELAAFAGTLRLARLQACFLRKDFARALRDAEALAKRRPDGAEAQFWLGEVRSARSLDELAREGKSMTLLEAVRDYEAATRLDPAWAAPWTGLGRAFIQTGLIERATGDPSGKSLHKAVDCLTEALTRSVEDPQAWFHRGVAWTRLAELPPSRQSDPAGSLEHALADFDQALARHPRWSTALLQRALAWRTRASADAAKGADPAASWDRAMADFDAALGLEPASLNARLLRALALQQQAIHERARGGTGRTSLERSIADLEEVVKREPSYGIAWKYAGIAWDLLGDDAKAVAAFAQAVNALGTQDAALIQMHARSRARAAMRGADVEAWLKSARDAAEAMDRGDYAAARPAYRAALQAADAAHAEDSALLRQVLWTVHFDLARIEALLSVGRASPADPPAPVSPETADVHRADAFLHLRKLFDLGWPDRASVEAHADLQPLHGQPAWRELFGE